MSTETKCLDCGAPVTRELISWCDACWQGRNTPIEQPAPVSATEPDAVRMLREGMRGQHALFNVNQEYVCAVAPLLEYIDALTARLAEAERVTEEQVERACVAVAAANQTPWPTGDVAFDQRIHRRMHTALTAARGGG